MAPGVFLSRAETQNTTLAQPLDCYRREIAPQKRGARTEQSHLKSISEDPVASCVVAHIAGKELAAFRNRQLKTVPASILNRELNILSHVFTMAAQERNIHPPLGSPVQLMRRPRVQNKRETAASWVTSKRGSWPPLESMAMARSPLLSPGSSRPPCVEVRLPPCDGNT